MGWKDRIFSKSGRRLFAGANFIVYTAVVIAMVVLVNWFVDRHNRRWDLGEPAVQPLGPDPEDAQRPGPRCQYLRF